MLIQGVGKGRGLNLSPFKTKFNIHSTQYIILSNLFSNFSFMVPTLVPSNPSHKKFT